MKQRIKAYREAAGLSVEHVSARLGVGKSAVYHWENLEHPSKPSLENLIVFSQLVDRSVSELLGQGDSAGGGHRRGSVPVVTIDEVQSPTFLDELRVPDEDRVHLPCPDLDCSPDSFAMVIAGRFNQTSDARSYPDGCVAYFDPRAECSSGDMVLAVLPSGHAVVREYVVDGDVQMLVPLNPRFKPIDAPFTLFAQLIGAYRPDKSGK